MSSRNNKNHYFGILAEWYDKLVGSEKNDIRYYVSFVSERKGSALELACGTGRILIPICKSGTEIDGVDIAPEMLAKCRDKLDSQDLHAGLYEQDLVSFDTGKSYDTIFISGGSFCMIHDIEEAQQSLVNVYKNLNAGGVFLLDIFNPVSETGIEDIDKEKHLRTAEEGENRLTCFGNMNYDIEEQLINGSYTYNLYEKDRLIETVKDDFKMRWYGKYEFKLLLENAGFDKIEIEPADMMSSHNRSLIYRAYK